MTVKELPRSVVRPDWEWIRAEWESDTKSDRQIAAQSTLAGKPITHNAIGKKAAKEGWKRKPLGAQVRAQVEARLAAAAVPMEIPAIPSGNASAEAILDAAARQGVEVIRQHRQHISRGRNLTVTMLEQLEDATNNVAEMQQLVEEETKNNPDLTPSQNEERAKRRVAMLRAVGLQSRASILKDLSTAARNWIGLERTAHNLNDQSTAPDSIEERLARLEK